MNVLILVILIIGGVIAAKYAFWAILRWYIAGDPRRIGYILQLIARVLVFVFRRQLVREGRQRERERSQAKAEMAEEYRAYKMRSYRQEISARKLWFDPDSPNDLKVTTYSELQEPIEVDTINALRSSQSETFHPHNEFVIYQQWGKNLPDGGRYYYWLDIDTATTVAEIIKGGPTHKLILMCTTFQPGAIQRFAEALVQDQLDNSGSQLEYLGLFWYFSGDDITDNPECATEIAYAANSLQLKRLSILTGAFNSECEDHLVEGLRQNSTLECLSVFYKDEQYIWEQIPTPRVDEMLRTNRDE